MCSSDLVDFEGNLFQYLTEKEQKQQCKLPDNPSSISSMHLIFVEMVENRVWIVVMQTPWLQNENDKKLNLFPNPYVKRRARSTGGDSAVNSA